MQCKVTLGPPRKVCLLVSTDNTTIEFSNLYKDAL